MGKYEKSLAHLEIKSDNALALIIRVYDGRYDESFAFKNSGNTYHMMGKSNMSLADLNL